MALLHPRLLAFAVVVALARAATPSVEAWRIPPLDGELHGEFGPAMLDGRPSLKWTLAVRTERPRERDIAFAIDGEGFQVQGIAQADPMGNGTWRVASAN